MWLTKSLFSAFSLLSFGLLTNLPFVNLIKAASFHGYLQACSKVPFLRNPRFKQIAKHGPWHSESNLDPKSRMGFWGGVSTGNPVIMVESVLGNRAESLPGVASAPH